nr:uncharacterized protein LOC111774794 [Equus caballus]
MEGTDNQGAGEQGRPVRQKLYRGIDHNSAGALLAKDGPEKVVMEVRKTKEMRPNVSSHLNMSTFNDQHRRQENPKEQDGKGTKAAAPPAESPSPPEAERAGRGNAGSPSPPPAGEMQVHHHHHQLGRCRLSIATTSWGDAGSPSPPPAGEMQALHRHHQLGRCRLTIATTSRGDAGSPSPPPAGEMQALHLHHQPGRCRLSIATTSGSGQPTGRNEYEIPGTREEQKIRAEDLKCLLFAH